MKKYIKRFVLGIVVLFLFFYITKPVSAAINIPRVLYALHKDGLAEYAMFGVSVTDLFRSILFGLAKFFASIIDALYISLSEIFKFMNFTKSEGLIKYVDNFMDLAELLFGISLGFFGLYIFIKPEEREGSVITNILISALIVFMLPTFTGYMSNLTYKVTEATVENWGEFDTGTAFYNASGAAKDAGQSSSKVAAISDIAFGNNVVDLLRVDAELSDSNPTPWRDKSGNPKGFFIADNILGGAWKSIDINQKVDYENISSLKNKKLWTKRLVDFSNPNATDKDLVAMDGSMFTIYALEQGYYRFQIISWFSLLVQLILIAVVLCFTTFKCAMLIFNIGQALIFTPLLAVTDIATGQRSKEAIKGIISLFAAFFLAIALMGMFFVGYSYVIQYTKDSSFIVRAILLIALTAVTIDGPDLIERIIGVDVGVKSGFRTAMAAYGVGKAASGVAKGAVAGAKKLGSGALTAAVGKKGRSELSETNPLTHGAGIRGLFKGNDDPLMPNENSRATNYQGADDNNEKSNSSNNESVDNNVKNNDTSSGKGDYSASPFSSSSSYNSSSPTSNNALVNSEANKNSSNLSNTNSISTQKQGDAIKSSEQINSNQINKNDIHSPVSNNISNQMMSGKAESSSDPKNDSSPKGDINLGDSSRDNARDYDRSTSAISDNKDDVSQNFKQPDKGSLLSDDVNKNSKNNLSGFDLHSNNDSPLNNNIDRLDRNNPFEAQKGSSNSFKYLSGQHINEDGVRHTKNQFEYPQDTRKSVPGRSSSPNKKTNLRRPGNIVKPPRNTRQNRTRNPNSSNNTFEVDGNE